MKLVYTTFLIVTMSVIRLWAQDSCTSNTISLSVSSKPMVTVSGATTICSGGSATLQATTTGGIGVCLIQWQLSEDGGLNYKDILGENKKNLQANNLSKTTYFRALYNCDGIGCSSQPSDPQIITVVDKPLVSILPNQLFSCQNAPFTITAAVSAGSGLPTYQWQSSLNGSTWTDISGKTAAIYATNNLSKTTYFRVVVTEQGDGCISTSAPVQISVDGCSGAIGDYVWLDCDKNGVQDGDEKGLVGVPVTLNGTDIAGNMVIKNTTTDASGFYLFNNLQAGTYFVTFGFPPNISGLVFTTKNAGNSTIDSDVDASGKTDAIVLKSGETRKDIDAGFVESQGPTFTSIPKNITVDCDKIPPAPVISATDIFGAAAVINASETKTNSTTTCPSAYILMRKWTAKDNCGNVTTATQIITVQDTTAPVFTFVPPDVTIGCKDPIPNGADAKATDNCGLDKIVQRDDLARDPNVNCSNRILLRTFTAKDLCGNSSTAMQKITIRDTEAPIFTNVPQNMTVQCDKIPPLGAFTLTATDNCDANPIISDPVEKIVNGSCNGRFVSTRIWTVTDGCGNKSDYTQTLIVEDTIKPIVLRVPNDITVDLSKGETIPTEPILYQDIIATDNCDVNPVLQFNKTQPIPSGNCQTIFQRVWTAINNCGNTSSKTQNITLINNPPVATVVLNIPETCANNDGQITLSPANYIYRWNDGGTGAVRNNLTSGTYSVSVVSSATCSTTQQVIVKKLCLPCIAPILSVAKTDISCGKTDDGTVTIAITNGNVADYKFIWTPNVSSTNTAKNLTKGIYSIRVEKLNDATCFATIQLSIDNTPDVAIADAAIINAGCNSTTGSATFNTNGDNGYKFLWDDGNTQSTRNDLAVGNYKITVSHATQCDVVKQVQIISTGNKPVVTIDVNKSETCTDKNGVVQLSPANLVYRWNDGIIGASRNNLAAGDYSVSVYNTPTCFIEQKITVGRNCVICAAPIVLVKTTDQSCSHNSDGKAVVSISNGSLADYKFIWSPAVSNTSSANNLVPGDYIVRVEKLADPTCFSLTNFKINPAIDVGIDTPTILNANCQTNGSISFNANKNYTFVWNDNDTNRVRTNLVAENYIVTVSRAGQCSITKSFTINKICVPPTDTCKTPIVSLTKIDLSCAIGILGQATVNINNGNVSDYTFTWTPNISSTNTANNLSVGNYTVKIVRNNLASCDTTIKFIINDANKLLVDKPIVKPEDCVSLTGSIDYTNPANVGLKFRWNDLDTNRLRTKLTPGLYVVTITDPKSNRCPFTDTIAVSNNNPLHTSSEIRSQPTCGKPNGYVKLTTTGGSGQYIYSWGEGDSRFVLPAGTTTVTTTDVQTGCKTTVTFNLINQNIEAGLILDSLAQLTCNGSADARVNYIVTPGRGFVYPINIEIHDDQSHIATNGALQAGKYIFQVKDSTGCVAVERNFTVTQPDIITATFTKRSQTCDASGSVSLKVSGGNAPYRYLWSDANGNTTDKTIRSDLLPGTYSVTVLDAGSCTIVIKNIAILDSCPCRLPVIDSIASTSATCGENNGGGKIYLKKTLNINKYQFDWIPAIGNVNIVGNERTSLASGVYSVIISQRSNPSCFINANVGIGSLQGPKNITTVSTPATCEAANGSATFVSPTPADSLTYTWLLDNSNSVSRNDLKTGFYQVLVTKNNLQDCPTLVNVRIESQNNLTATAEIIKKATCGLANGVATITATGGSNIYTYNWSIGGTSDATRNNLLGGIYSVTVTDQQTKCTSLVTLTMPNEVIGKTTVELQDTILYTRCVNTSDAQVQFRIISSLPSGINYQLLDGATGKVIGDSSRLIAQGSLLITNLSIGRYCLVAKDSNGCILTSKCFEVKNPIPLSAVATKVNRTCDAKGIINVAVTGGAGNYSYQWSDNPIILTASRSDLIVGSYSITVTDANGCNIILDTLNIRNDCTTNPVCSFGGTNNVAATVRDITCTIGGSITMTINGGIAPYKFDWLDLTGTNNPQNRTDLQAGIYSAIIIDATGCKDTVQNIIVKNTCDSSHICTPPSIANISVTDARCGISSGAINIGTSELSAISYQLSAINFDPSSVNFKLSADGLKLIADSLRAGLYHVKISRTNDTNCFIERNIIIKNQDGLKIEAPTITPATCSASNGKAQFTSGVGALQFNWSDGKSGISRNDLAAGQYYVTVTDLTKTYCDQVIAVEIKSTNSLSATTTIDKEASCGRSDGQATVNVISGSGNYELRIKNEELRINAITTSPINNLAAGNYSIIITDDVTGCTITTSLAVINTASSSATINLSSNTIYTSCAGTNDASVVFNVTYSANFAQPAKIEIKNEIGVIVGSGLVPAQTYGPGKYTIQVSDATGCLITTTNFEIKSPTPIIASAQTQSQKCTQLGSISLNVSGGTGIYQLRIKNKELRIDSIITRLTSQRFNELKNLRAGNYQLTISDSRGCSVLIDKISIANDSINCGTCTTKESVSVKNKNCTTNGGIIASATGGQAPYIFDWLDVPGIDNGTTRTNLKEGTYYVVVIDTKGCRDTVKAVVLDSCTTPLKCTLTATPTVINKTCNKTGSITVTVTGGVLPYTFDWLDLPGINNVQNRTNLQVGTYLLIVADANGCKDTMTNVTVKDVCTPVTCDVKGLATVTNKTCNATGSIVVSVTGGKAPFNFDWNDLPGTNNPQNRFDLGDGFYTLIITDAAGCRDTMSSLIIKNDCNGSNGSKTCIKPVIASVSTLDSKCNSASGSIRLTIDSINDLRFALLDVQFNIVHSPIVKGQSSIEINNLLGGAYTLKIMRNADTTCFAQQIIIIKNSDAVVGTGIVPVLTPATCAGSTGGADFGNANGLNFIWSDGKFGAKRTDLAKGNYFVTISDITKTYCDQIIQVEIPATNGNLITTSVINKQPACGRADGQATINVTGGSGNYQLRIKNETLSIDTLTTSQINNLAAGNYTIIVTDAVTGCSSTSSLSVTNATNSSATINLASTSVSTSCAGKYDASVAFDINYSANFVQPAKIEIKNANGIIVGAGLSPAQLANQQYGIGKYTIQVSDAIGCLIVTKSFEVTAPKTISAEVQTKSVTCTERGNITLNVIGGTGNYKYIWKDGSITQNRSNLNASEYAVTIIDANACPLELSSIKVANDSVNCTTIPPKTSCGNILVGGQLSTINCQLSTGVCTRLNQIDTLNYKIYDNGILYKSGFSQCSADTSVSYTYFTLVQNNSNGPWTLNEWLLNGHLYQGTFNSIQALADSMNVWDAPHQWQLDTTTYSIYSLNNTRSYDKMLWSKNGLPIAELNTSVYEQYRRYGIKLDTGMHIIIISNPTQGCADTVHFNVETKCNPSPQPTTSCSNLIDGQSSTVSVVCGEKANICTKLTGADTLIYKVYNNGNLYTDGFTKCRADTSVNYNYFTLILSSANGPWTLNEWLVNGQLHKGTFHSIQSLVDSMNVWDVPNKWQLDSKSFTIYSAGNKNIFNNMFWSKNGKPIAQLISSYYEEYRQVGLKLNVGAHQIIFENPVQHCRDTAQINVKCFPLVGGTEHVEAKINEKHDSVVIKVPHIDSLNHKSYIIKAVSDHTVAFQYQTVQIEPMLNDSLHGEKAVIMLVEPPTFGRAVLNQARGVVSYTPQDDPCEKRDSFRYALVTANARDTAWITIEVVCDDLIVFTGFSPNGDGINDFFVIKGLENYKNNHLMIYNRFGNLVYETKNYQNDWAGTLNNQNLPDGTYFYIIDLGNGDQKSGYVQIQR